MRKYIFLLLFLFLSGSVVYSQDTSSHSTKFKKLIDFSFGMGISLSNTSSLNDYLRDAIPFTNKDSVKSFSVGLEFFGGIEMELSKKFCLKLDYSYFFRGNTYNYPPFIYDISYHIHQPVIMVYYIFPGKSFKFKLGAGAGYSFAQLSNSVSGSEIIYNASGPGLKGEILFSAPLSDRMSSYVSGFIMGNIIGNLKDSNGNILKDPITNASVNLSNFGFGLRLGLCINLN
jgi:hypothetical protein